MDSNKIYYFTINSATGALDADSGNFVTTSEESSIGEMAADPSGRYLYVAKGSRSGSYGMLTYEINSATGGLSLVQELKMDNSPKIVAVDPAGDFVAVTHFNDGITIFSIDSIKMLKAHKTISIPNFKPEAITFDRTGAYLFVAGDLLDENHDNYIPNQAVIHVYSKNTDFGEIDGSPFVTYGALKDDNTRGIAVGPQGSFLYVLNASTAAVSYHSIDAEGKLGSFQTYNNRYLATAFAINGNFLYLANSSSLAVDVYSINADGSLTGTGFSVSLDKPAEMLVVDPSGKFLYANEYMGSGIQVFSINSDGSLIPGSRLYVGEKVKAIVIVGKK